MRGAKQKEMLEISDLRRGEILHLRSAGPFSLREGGGGYSYIFIHTWAQTILWGSKFEFQYFMGFQKTE